MSDTPQPQQESQVKGISIRAIIALILVLAVCVLAFLRPEFGAKVAELAMLAVTFYFVQKNIHPAAGDAAAAPMNPCNLVNLVTAS